VILANFPAGAENAGRIVGQGAVYALIGWAIARIMFGRHEKAQARYNAIAAVAFLYLAYTTVGALSWSQDSGSKAELRRAANQLSALYDDLTADDSPAGSEATQASPFPMPSHLTADMARVLDLYLRQAQEATDKWTALNAQLENLEAEAIFAPQNLVSMTGLTSGRERLHAYRSHLDAFALDLSAQHIRMTSVVFHSGVDLRAVRARPTFSRILSA
jgi:hypothetical protein